MKLILALFTLLMAACVWAQDAGSTVLKGRVLDPSNAVMAGVTIHAKDTDTNEVATTITGPQGDYTFPSLRPGMYSISVDVSGFKTFVQEGLALNAGQITTLNISLEIEAIAQQVTVTAKAPDFVEALEVREVRESSARDVGEALTQVEGLWKIRKGGIANDVILRGFQQDNLNVLVDGVRIYGACPNNMDPPAFHVDFAEIQQVEVIKGAFDVVNQGSLGGSVNIVSKIPPSGIQVTPNFSMGSFGYYNPSLNASFSNKTLYGLGGYSFRRSKPYIDGSGKPFTEYANYKESALEFDAFRINTAWFKFGVSPRENHHLEFAYTRQGGGLVLYPYLLMDALNDDADRLSASYRISELSGPLKRLQVQSYFTRVNHWMTDEYRLSSVNAARPYGMATLAETRVLGGRVEAQFSGLTAGFEGYRRNWNVMNTMRMSGMYMDQSSLPDVKMSVAGLYGQYEKVFFEKLRINAGIRLDTAHSEAQKTALNTDLFWAYNNTRDLSKTDTSPTANIRFSYALPKGIEVFMGLGHTVRLPDPQERFFALERMGSDWVGNPGLEPTGNTEVDFGINFRGNRLSLRPTFFYSHLTNFVTVHNQSVINPVPTVMNSAARSYENVQARMYGGELAYSLGLSRTLVLLGGLSYARGTKDPIPIDGIRDRNLAEIPPLKSRTALRYGTKFFFGEVEALVSDSQQNVDSDLREQRTAGYGILNLKMGVHTNKLNFTAGIDNVLDRFYYEHCSYQRDPFRSGVKVPEPGRNFYLSVSYAF